MQRAYFSLCVHILSGKKIQNLSEVTNETTVNLFATIDRNATKPLLEVSNKLADEQVFKFQDNALVCVVLLQWVFENRFLAVYLARLITGTEEFTTDDGDWYFGDLLAAAVPALLLVIDHYVAEVKLSSGRSNLCSTDGETDIAAQG